MDNRLRHGHFPVQRRGCDRGWPVILEAGFRVADASGRRRFYFGGLLALAWLLPLTVQADVRLPALFGDHMVLQQSTPNPVWGWADPGEAVEVTLGEQHKSTTADDQGRWRVQLDPLTAGGPWELAVRGKNQVSFRDVLVGEVWICSGQSNMAFPVSRALDADLEIPAARYPQIRLMSVPQVGTQEPQEDFRGQWQVCGPETVADFSAVGYYFGRHLHRTLDVPIGLIDNAWGGSACEAWIDRKLLEADARYRPLLEHWTDTEQRYDHRAATAAFQRRLAAWQEAAAQARRDGQQPPARPRPPRNPLVGQHRPGNLYNGVLRPLIGYGIRGVIWYQGEANASRAEQYRHLFPLMIQHWRDEWQLGDFPFYWVQLADFRAEAAEPGESDWAELREAQTNTQTLLPHTGQAVIIDLGEGKDIHPRNKRDVALRLARWALANQYELPIVCQSPVYQSHAVRGERITVTFDVGESELMTVDRAEPVGFTVAGAEGSFVPAQARLVDGKTVEVWSPSVERPREVRYAWADNPVCNLYNREGLPVTPFRSDARPGVTRDKHVR